MSHRWGVKEPVARGVLAHVLQQRLNKASYFMDGHGYSPGTFSYYTMCLPCGTDVLSIALCDARLLSKQKPRMVDECYTSDGKQLHQRNTMGPTGGYTIL